ncbi:MAG: hypothetical protein WBA68_00560 [Alteraurantiacibacter sp.]
MRGSRGFAMGAALAMGALVSAPGVAQDGQTGIAEGEPFTHPLSRVVIPEPTQVAYRANGSDDSYLLALGDNGNAISESLVGLVSTWGRDSATKINSDAL